MAFLALMPLVAGAQEQAPAEEDLESTYVDI